MIVMTPIFGIDQLANLRHSPSRWAETRVPPGCSSHPHAPAGHTNSAFLFMYECARIQFFLCLFRWVRECCWDCHFPHVSVGGRSISLESSSSSGRTLIMLYCCQIFILLFIKTKHRSLYISASAGFCFFLFAPGLFGSFVVVFVSMALPLLLVMQYMCAYCGGFSWDLTIRYANCGNG